MAGKTSSEVFAVAVVPGETSTFSDIEQVRHSERTPTSVSKLTGQTECTIEENQLNIQPFTETHTPEEDDPWGSTTEEESVQFWASCKQEKTGEHETESYDTHSDNNVPKSFSHAGSCVGDKEYKETPSTLNSLDKGTYCHLSSQCTLKTRTSKNKEIAADSASVFRAKSENNTNISELVNTADSCVRGNKDTDSTGTSQLLDNVLRHSSSAQQNINYDQHEPRNIYPVTEISVDHIPGNETETRDILNLDTLASSSGENLCLSTQRNSDAEKMENTTDTGITEDIDLMNKRNVDER